MNKQMKAANELKEMFFKSLDQIYTVCEANAKDFNSKSIPLSMLDLCIKEVKKGFNQGFKDIDNKH